VSKFHSIFRAPGFMDNFMFTGESRPAAASGSTTGLGMNFTPNLAVPDARTGVGWNSRSSKISIGAGDVCAWQAAHAPASAALSEGFDPGPLWDAPH